MRFVPFACRPDWPVPVVNGWVAAPWRIDVGVRYFSIPNSTIPFFHLPPIYRLAHGIGQVSVANNDNKTLIQRFCFFLCCWLSIFFYCRAKYSFCRVLRVLSISRSQRVDSSFLSNYLSDVIKENREKSRPHFLLPNPIAQHRKWC